MLVNYHQSQQSPIIQETPIIINGQQETQKTFRLHVSGSIWTNNSISRLSLKEYILLESINLDNRGKEDKESDSNGGKKRSKEGPLEQLLLCPQLLLVLVHNMAPVHVVLLVVQVIRLTLTRGHHWDDRGGPTACPWALLLQFRVDLGIRRRVLEVLRGEREAGDLWRGAGDL